MIDTNRLKIYAASREQMQNDLERQSIGLEDRVLFID